MSSTIFGRTRLRGLATLFFAGAITFTTLSVAPTATAEPTVPNQSDRARGKCSLLSHVPKRRTIYGASISTSGISLEDSLRQEDRRLGRLPIVRLFDPDVPPRNAWSRRKPVLGNRQIVASFRPPPRKILSGRYDKRIRRWFRNVPRGQHVYWSYYHEPERDIDSGNFTSRQYRRAWRRLARIAARTCNPKLHSTLILTGWTAEPKADRKWGDYWPGKRFIDVVGFDPYNSASHRPKRYVRPAKLFRPVVRLAKRMGKPFGIAETGTQLIRGDKSGKGRARWLRRMARYFNRHNAVFVTYFQSDHKFDYRLLDRPSKRAWRKFVTR